MVKSSSSVDPRLQEAPGGESTPASRVSDATGGSSRPLRIVHLATTYPLHDGDSNAVFVESLAEATAARGHRVDVVLPWHPELSLERPGRRATLHAFVYTPVRAWHPWGYAQALTADRTLRKDAYLAALPAAWTAAREIRRLLASSDVDVLHAHWLLPNGPIAAAARGRDSGPPLVISCHGSGVFLAERHGWARRLAAWSLKRAAAVTACSSDLAGRAGRLGSGPTPRRIPYGVDVERFRPPDRQERERARRRLAAAHGLDPGARWVFAVGRLVHKKGFDRLVAALPGLLLRHPTACAVVGGDGPLRDALRRQAGAERALHLIGGIANRDMPDWYAAADVVAVPSVVGPGGNVDGLPNVLLEAMACGAPLVASRVAGIPDVVRDDVEGVLVEPGDADALATELAALLDGPERRQRLGAAARRRVEEELSWERIAARFEELYLEALGG